MITITSNASAYAAKCWAAKKSKAEILQEISELENLWIIRHDNPFAKNAHYTHQRIETLKAIAEKM